MTVRGPLVHIDQTALSSLAVSMGHTLVCAYPCYDALITCAAVQLENVLQNSVPHLGRS